MLVLGRHRSSRWSISYPPPVECVRSGRPVGYFTGLSDCRSTDGGTWQPRHMESPPGVCHFSRLLHPSLGFIVQAHIIRRALRSSLDYRLSSRPLACLREPRAAAMANDVKKGDKHERVHLVSLPFRTYYTEGARGPWTSIDWSAPCEPKGRTCTEGRRRPVLVTQGLHVSLQET